MVSLSVRTRVIFVAPVVVIVVVVVVAVVVFVPDMVGDPRSDDCGTNRICDKLS